MDGVFGAGVSKRREERRTGSVYPHSKLPSALLYIHTSGGGRAMDAGKSGTQMRPLYWLDLSSSIGRRSWPLLDHLPKLTCQSVLRGRAGPL